MSSAGGGGSVANGRREGRSLPDAPTLVALCHAMITGLRPHLESVWKSFLDVTGGGEPIRYNVYSSKIFQHRKMCGDKTRKKHHSFTHIHTHAHTQNNNKQLPVCVKSHDHHEGTHNCVTCKLPLMHENAAGCYWPLSSILTCQAPPPLLAALPPSSGTPPSREAHTRRITGRQTTASSLVRLRCCK